MLTKGQIHSALLRRVATVIDRSGNSADAPCSWTRHMFEHNLNVHNTEEATVSLAFFQVRQSYFPSCSCQRSPHASLHTSDKSDSNTPHHPCYRRRPASIASSSLCGRESPGVCRHHTSALSLAEGRYENRCSYRTSVERADTIPSTVSASSRDRL